MSKEVTVDLKDLQLLVKLLYAYSVESQAQRLVRKNQPKENRLAVKKYLEAVSEMIPAARKIQKARFAVLLSSLRADFDVHLALASFVAHEAKSSPGTGTKPRPPR